MNTWHKLHITDKSGKEFFTTTASPMSTASEIKNLTQHLKNATKYPAHYKFLDIPTAVLMLDDSPYGENTKGDEELLKELGLK